MDGGALVGCSPWGRKESGMTERLHFDFSLSCIGEGNGSPLQCSCLENPRDGGAWWAAVYGVAQSQTRLKRLSSSRSSSSSSREGLTGRRRFSCPLPWGVCPRGCFHPSVHVSNLRTDIYSHLFSSVSTPEQHIRISTFMLHRHLKFIVS